MDTAQVLLREAEDQIESWWCELDERWREMVAAAQTEAQRVIATAQAEAASLVAAARHEAETLQDAARAEAQAVLAAAKMDVEAERALSAAEAVMARGLEPEDLEGLRQAIDRLRTELSRVVDAAFDALPAVEATAAAVDQALGEEPEADPEPEPELVAAGPAPKRGRLRRLFRRS